MNCRAVHFALTEEDPSSLEALTDEQAPLDLLQTDLEDRCLEVPKRKSPTEVRAINAALAGITRDDLRQRHDRIDPQSYGQKLDDTGFESNWHWFESAHGLYCRFAAAGRDVLFTVDQ